MKNIAAFVSEHIGDDTSRLVLDRGKYPGIDIDLAVNCIESRRKLKGKINEWYDNPELVFPIRLSAEQCSSSATGLYKAGLADRIAGKDGGWTIIDFTGGLGVDSWCFSKKASKVTYCEMQEALCTAARHNFEVLKAGNIEVCNIQVTDTNCGDIIQNHGADIVYMDPARRGTGGKKVFLIEDCTPDVLSLKDEIFRHAPHILIKLSPMADITMVCNRLGATCREVHVVAVGGECKELVIWMDREWNGEARVVAVEMAEGLSNSRFEFNISEEKRLDHYEIANGQVATLIPALTRLSPSAIASSALMLFEPGKALMKAGPFNLIGSRLGLYKLGKSTHYYVTSSQEKVEELKGFGKVFRIRECLSLDKRNIKEVGKKYPRAEVTARNIPMDTDTLRKKLGVTSGDDAHIFGLKSDTEGNLLIIAERI